MLSRLRAYAELLRVSNVLTAVADVWMGMIVATGTLAPASVSVPLTLCSVCLYLSGMVLNDVFDAKKDAVERPTRPIPSGRIVWKAALRLAAVLVIAAIVIAWWVGDQWNLPGLLPVAVMLTISIGLYSGPLKKTVFGPVVMGVCRGFNVALGATAFGEVSRLKGSPTPPECFWFIFAGIIVYVVGLTFFARSEASGTKRQSLTYASIVSLTGVALMCFGPDLTMLWTNAMAPPSVPIFRWRLLWLVIALLIGRRYVAAILQPTPKHIQAAVGNAIQGIILIDAALAWGYAGPYWGLAILALLPPTMLMARFIPQT